MLNPIRSTSPKALESTILGELTERELEIVRLVATGLSNTEIAQELFISNHTVKTHRKNINRKLEISNPVQLTLVARKAGLVTF